jgi:hypothetical protein
MTVGMSKPSITENPSKSPTPNGLATRDEIRRIAEEIELEVHLAGMTLRDRWRLLAPRVEALEQWLKRSGDKAGAAVTDEMYALAALLRKLREDIADRRPH